jgi:hypothetical protein
MPDGAGSRPHRAAGNAEEGIMRKHLIAVTALVGATATAGPALARPADTFAPGTSDAAQSGRTADDTTASGPLDDLRGDAARASAEPRSEAVSGDLRGDAARAATEPRVPVVVEVQPPAGDGLDWTSIGLGAGGGIALLAIGAGGVVLISRRGPRVGTPHSR